MRTRHAVVVVVVSFIERISLRVAANDRCIFNRATVSIEHVLRNLIQLIRPFRSSHSFIV